MLTMPTAVPYSRPESKKLLRSSTQRTFAPFSFGFGGSLLLYEVQKSAIFIVDTSSAVSSFCYATSKEGRKKKKDKWENNFCFS